MSSVQNSTEYSSQNNSVVLDEYDDADEEENEFADQSPSHYSSDALPQDNSIDGTFDGSMTSQLDNESVNTSRRTDNDSRGEVNDTSGQGLRYRNRPRRRQEEQEESEEGQRLNKQEELNIPHTRPSSLSPSAAATTPAIKVQNEMVSNARRPVTVVRSVSRGTNNNRRVGRTPSRESSVNEQTVNSTLNYTVTSYNSPSSARTPSYVDEERTLGESQEYYYDDNEDDDEYEYDYTHGDYTEEATHLTTHNDNNEDSTNIAHANARQPRRVKSQSDVISQEQQPKQLKGQLQRPQRPSQRSLSESQLTYEQYDNSYDYNEEEEEEEQYSSGYGSMTYEDSALRSPRSASERSATFASFYYTNPTLQRIWEQAYFLRRPIFFIVCATTGNTFISLLSTLMRSVHKQTHANGNYLSDNALDALRRQPSASFNENHVVKIKTQPEFTLKNTNTVDLTLTAEGINPEKTLADVSIGNENNVNSKATETTVVTPVASAVELPSGYPNVPEWLREIRASLPAVVERPVAWCLRKSNIPVLSELQQAQWEQNAKQQQEQQQQETIPVELSPEIAKDAPFALANEEIILNHNDIIDKKDYVGSISNTNAETSAMVPAALFVPILSLTILIIAKCIIARQNHENSLLLESNAEYEDEDVENLNTSNNIYMTTLDDKVNDNNNENNTGDSHELNNNSSSINNDNHVSISTSVRNGANIPPSESIVTLAEDNTFANSMNASVNHGNNVQGGNVMNDYLQAHVSSTTQGINNRNNDLKNVVVESKQEEQQAEDKERQTSEGENVSEGIVNTTNSLNNNNKILVAESLEVEDTTNTSKSSILVNDDENTLADELPETNNVIIPDNSIRSHRSAPVERVRSPSPEATVVNNVMEQAIPRPMTSRFALKGEVVAALVGNASINEINVLLVAATRYECARVFLSQKNMQALPNIVNTPAWLNVQFVKNVMDTISETALLHGLRRVGVFAQPIQSTPRNTNNELIPLPRFRHPANALYVFIAHTTLPQGQRSDAVSEYDKLANMVLANTESHVFSGPAHGEAGIPVNECFYDRLQKERQAERVNVAATTATNAEMQQMERERFTL